MEQLYSLYRTDLFKLAYRMLGSVTEAEDVIQDLFVTLQTQENRNDIANWKAYLLKMTTNRCINVLRSARRLRVSYPGTWLPEPLYESNDQPQHIIERQEGLSYALLVLMERLTPSERAVYVLRTAFDFPHPQIAEFLGKTEASCRKMYSRAAAKLNLTDGSETSTLRLDTRVTEAFVQSVESGNYRKLVELLMEEVTLWSDGGGVVRSAFNPILGLSRAIAFFEGVAKKNVALVGNFRQVLLNGEPALILYQGGIPSLVLCFDYEQREGKVRNVYWIRNPHKLSHLPKLISEDVTL
ncbi:sigma-70 family RNA polymerase sigma factor [Cohnella silvisoli]|uniref:Sigma-70 family RNA polymerase sigma factor n=1 Tax=Cohnella silvisoli TaxID=2873699 RepID=A0ABV1KZU6_9BACL|nr:sigma-70 family RNA polymerase sigma factor [Cohnella silvisoli]MCD9021788.1 sigma-70 family RNA polymerase sigma factor [Cohnella silvisoli]